MSMNSISPDSLKTETDLRDDLSSGLHILRSTRSIGWGIHKKVRNSSRKRKEVNLSWSSREGESESKGQEKTKQGMDDETQVEENMVEVNRLRGGKRIRDGNVGENERKTKKNSLRWSNERIESAKQSLHEVVKAMGATWQKPALRHNLREKARKRIGDTGLLDHLLKHMAGEEFSDGKERLIRRHNTEGAIEYWLEPAELKKIRQDAGITDQYWVPPPGWKPGDTISTNGNCGCHCKEEISFLRR